MLFIVFVLSVRFNCRNVDGEYFEKQGGCVESKGCDWVTSFLSSPKGQAVSLVLRELGVKVVVVTLTSTPSIDTKLR